LLTLALDLLPRHRHMELVTRGTRGASSRLGFYIFAAMLLLRLVVLARMADSPFLLPSHGDMAFYNDWARRILHGEGVERGAFYGLPGYAYLLAGIYYLAGYSPFIPEFLQACADAGTGLLIYLISLRLFCGSANSSRASWIGALAALGWAFFQPAQAYSAVLMPTALAVFVFWFVVWQIVQRDRLPKLPWFGIVGCLIGLSATAVATTLFLLPLLVIACFCKWRPAASARQFWISRIFCALLLFGGVTVGTAPCWIHNYFYARDPVLLSAHSGVNFWIGNNPAANGYPKFPPGLHAGQKSMLQDSISAAEQDAGHPLRRSEVSAYWSHQATSYIRQHFGAWLRLVLKKIGNFWNAFQYDDLSIITILRDHGITLPGPGFGIVGALGLAGLIFALIASPAAAWIAGAIALQMCALLPVFITERYRLSAVPGLLIFASFGLCWFFHYCMRMQIPAFLAYAAAVGAATALVSIPQRDESLWALDDYNAGIVALDLGDYPMAKAKLDLAYTYVPDNAEVNFAEGNLHLTIGDRTKAKQFYRSTLKLDPQHCGALNNLGLLAIEEKRWDLAIQFLMGALIKNSADAKGHFLLAEALLAHGENHRAREEVTRALALNPAQPEYQSLAARIQNQ
jgi:tetratricopeptide (TPR) repeat protein